MNNKFLKFSTKKEEFILNNILNFKNTKKGLLTILSASMIMLTLSSVVLADNVTGPGSGVKAVNVLGYELDTHDPQNMNKIEVFLDKGLTGLNIGQFKIYQGTTPIAISSLTQGSKGCGWTQAQGMQPGGYDAVLTTSNNLSPDTEYKMVVSSTVTMGNSYQLSVGNYLQHNDITFNFKTPKTDGTYSGALNLTYIPEYINEATGASMNVEVISNIPIDTNDLTLSDMKLMKSSTEYGTYTDVTFDSTFDYNATTGAEYYAPQINNAHTCIFLPLTLGGGTPAYNLSDGMHYKLQVPAIDYADDAGDAQKKSLDPGRHFHVGGDTSTSLRNAQPTITAYNSSSVSLQWNNGSTDDSGVAPVSYKVYYSTNPYFDFVDTGVTPTNNGTTSSATFTHSFQSGTTYYFRIVPVNSTGEEGGFSPYVSQGY